MASATAASPLDLDYVRSQFPGLDSDWTFFDNAGGTQILAGAIERLNEHLLHRNVQTGGSYAVSQAAASSLADGREAMRRLLNAERAEEIVFAPSSTVALQNLARSLKRQLQCGDEVIVTESDHESNIGPWMGLEEAGIRVLSCPLHAGGYELDLERLEAMLSERTRLVAVTHGSNILGHVCPIRRIAKLVHGYDALLCVDSVAVAPHRLIDVQELGIDFLVFSLYKIFGPHYAVMYGRYDRLVELDGLYHYFYGRDQVPAKLEPGNASYELAYSSTAILDYLLELGKTGAGANLSERQRLASAFAAVEAHERRIGTRLLDWLSDRSDCRIIGRSDGADPDRMPIISFRVHARHSGEIAREIDNHRIAIRYGDFHARRLVESLGLSENGGVVRVSMVHYNSLEEVDALVYALDQVLGSLRAG